MAFCPLFSMALATALLNPKKMAGNSHFQSNMIPSITAFDHMLDDAFVLITGNVLHIFPYHSEYCVLNCFICSMAPEIVSVSMSITTCCGGCLSKVGFFILESALQRAESPN